MALETLVAGAYAGAYNGVSTGITEQGFELTFETKAEEIGESDAFGESLIDFIYRGGRLSTMFESLAYKAGSITPFWPWGPLGVLGIIARLASNVAMPLTLTSTAGTPAAASPATLTFGKAILAPNNPARLLYNSKLRKVPVRLACLPYNIGAGVIAFGSST